ncbi:WS/DGAT/MGAT family O-acyltransferase [Marinobacter psychrophilus]|jgi:diacylglycerol O-acyltransferase|uniref:WS/DGAT/MGAT family O-acyltransferase n=1 Tax=Marinobacter psychrophilus TaxID=330734 RepID=UPI001B6FBD0A|nr:wax ester/triacylglycerol synthase family O-acyltransferase [Marinobacter psychrophilus]MBQ0762331.1 wax ester/triacylglycerol synthase family O-acyltransferase [Marinobacter psychrophilus]MBQ0843823.1 wax ester/triacylglycerol synthase family O-acyltransferase [Marinobacter psychrophilus]
MKRLATLDASWLAVESDDTPMHVGNLQIFSLPDNAPSTFTGDLVESMKQAGNVEFPWGCKLVWPSFLGRILAPAWKHDKHIDLDYHVRHSALPKPGGERELGVLVSRLHSNPLDLSRPLWECHMIEGLEHNRFALYTKMHHCMIDGISGVRLLQRVLSKSPDERDMLPPWSVRPESTRGKKTDSEASVPGAISQAMEALKLQLGLAPRLWQASNRLIRSVRHPEDGLTAPFTGPVSKINHRVTGQRRFATQQYQLEDMKVMARASGSSMNDIVLYLCGTALRRFLLEQDDLPETSLTAGIPVNIRPADDEGTGTQISFMIAALATNEPDPLTRLKHIKESSCKAKEHLQKLPKKALTQYTMMLMSPYILQLMSGLGGRMRPVFNVTISNVPGPTEDLYYEGAKLEAMYPVSLITHGGALNITCLSYAGSLNFGFTGCRDTLPSMQKLAVYTGEALEELRILLLPPKKNPSPRKPRTAAKKKPAVKSNAS